jgi:hypothetical protein
MLPNPDHSGCIAIEHNMVETDAQGTRDDVLDVLEYRRVGVADHDLVVGVLWRRERRVRNVGGNGARLDVRPAVYGEGWLVPCGTISEEAKQDLFDTHRFRARPMRGTRR